MYEECERMFDYLFTGRAEDKVRVKEKSWTRPRPDTNKVRVKLVNNRYIETRSMCW